MGMAYRAPPAEQVRSWVDDGIITKAQAQSILGHAERHAAAHRLDWPATTGVDVLATFLMVTLSQVVLLLIAIPAGRSAELAVLHVAAAAIAMAAGFVLRDRLEHRS